MRVLHAIGALAGGVRPTPLCDGVPYQKPGAAASVGLTVEECEAAAAVNASLAVALGTRFPLLFYALLGVVRLQDLLYALVAANRGRLPGDEPYCEQHPSGCR